MIGVIAAIPRFQFSNSTGGTLINGTVTTYLAGTTTPEPTYQDKALTTANPLVIPLDGRGECVIWLDSTKSYKFVLKNAVGATQWTQDDISGSSPVASLTGIFVKFADLSASSGSSLVEFQPSGVGATQRTVQAKLRDYVSIKDFGAVGDGATNDTAAVHAFLDYLLLTGANGHVNSGTYLTDSYYRNLLIHGGKSFTLTGDGPKNTRFKARQVANFFSWFNYTGLRISGIGLDCQRSVLGNAGHGFVIYNGEDVVVEDCEALDFKGSGFIGYTDSDATAIVYRRVFFRKCYAKASAALAAGEDCNGVLLSDYWYGGIIDCHAEDITSFGIELKQNSHYCHVADCSAKYCGIGFGMGQTTVGSDGCDKNIVSNFISRGCRQGGTIGEGTENLITGFLVDMFEVLAADQIDGFRFATDAARNTMRGFKSIGMRKPALRFSSGASGNTADLAQMSDNSGGYQTVAFDAGANDNYVEIGQVDGAINPMSTATDSGLRNVVSYPMLDQITGIAQYKASTGASGISAISTATHVLESTSGVIQHFLNGGTSWVQNIGVSGNNLYASQTVNSASAYWQKTINGIGYRWSATGYFAYTDNTIALGNSSFRWSVVYAGTGAINTSDEREKQQIQDIDSAALRAWAKVEYCQFKFNDAVAIKGDGARWHFGVVAQRVKEAFESEGLDPFAYGVLCYDEWLEQVEVIGDDGQVIEPYRAAGNRYGVRYEEAMCLQMALMRKRFDDLEGGINV